MLIESLCIRHCSRYLGNISDPLRQDLCCHGIYFKWIYCYGIGLCVMRYFARYCVNNKPPKTCGTEWDAFSLQIGWVVLLNLPRSWEICRVSDLGWSDPFCASLSIVAQEYSNSSGRGVRVREDTRKCSFKPLQHVCQHPIGHINELGQPRVEWEGTSRLQRTQTQGRVRIRTVIAKNLCYL